MADLTKSGMRTDYKIPPESSGSRISHYAQWVLKITNLSAPFGFPATFELATSGVKGSLHSVEPYEDGFRLIATLHSDSPLNGFTLNEQMTITNINSTSTATLKEWEQVLLNSTAITSAMEPDNSLAIDQVGAASVRFNEGQPQFDAFGLLRVTNTTRLSDYMFKYDALPTLFQEKKVGAGSLLTYLPNENSIAIDIGVDSGDYLTYTSNSYHPYTPGMGQVVLMTVAVGDSGKANVIRRWGYYDDDNGIYFELDGTELYAVIRSKASGTITETRVPRNRWSGDHLDGKGGEHNLSRVLLDITNVNIYWIDFAWLGAGRVRFGIYSPSGERIVCHAFDNANSEPTPYMGTADLPIRVEQRNTGTSISPSRMKLTCASVLTEGQIDDDYLRIHSRYTSWVAPSPVTVGDTETLLVAVRAGALFNGKINRRKIIPKKYMYYVEGNPVEVALRLMVPQIFSGPDWQPAHPAASGEYSIVGTPLSPGDLLATTFLNTGASIIDALDDFNSRNSFMSRLADGSEGVFVVFTAKCLTAGQTAQVKLALDWVEL